MPYQRQQKSHAAPTGEDVCIANSSLAGDRTGSQTSSFPDVMCGGMRQSGIHGLAVDADPWECPHAQERHSRSSRTHSSAAWLLLPTGQLVVTLPWCAPWAPVRCTQWFPELAVGELTSDSSGKTFFL